MQYEMVAGIEVHVQLNTKTKLFCGCSTCFGAPPNTQTCPVCLGLPGSLPVLNKSAFELAMRAALAINCTIAPYTKFDRKNYFYPDLPKGYQISQYDLPLSKDGYLDIDIKGKQKRIGIIRLHMEEDAGKLIHEGKDNTTLIDLNRAGMPLIETVSRPDISTSDEAVAYLTALKSIMQYIGVSDCDMEKGELRCDVNLSLRPVGSAGLGVKTEIKNLNSFKFAAKALEYEFERQRKILESGGTIAQETRLYDAEKAVTMLMRTKEDAHDYRYFPEPDLPPFNITQEWIEKIRKTIPELPNARRARLSSKYQLPVRDTVTITATTYTADFYERCVEQQDSPAPKIIANWIINNLLQILNDKGKEISQTKINPSTFVELIKLVESNTITGASAKEVLDEMIETGKKPGDVVKEKGLTQVSDSSELESVVEKVISENPTPVVDYKAGKKTAVTFLMGQIMKATKGKANPKVVSEILIKKLG